MLSFHSANLIPNVLPHQHQDWNNKSPISSSLSENPCNRRSVVLLATALSLPRPPTVAANTAPPLDTTITDRVFLDFSVCPNYFRGQGQAQSDPLCSESELLGRVVLGLYGKIVPITVANFKAMCTAGAMGYKNTLVHKVLPGQFLVAGRQGRRDKGEVMPPLALSRNTETVDSRAFMLEHSRPGILSLCLSENDDEDEIKLDPNYHNVEFLITTGPAPCPDLDGRNIVFGIVLQGMHVVRTIAATQTYQPPERIRQLNDLAAFLGDERAQIARTFWNRPLKSIYISDCGEVNVTKPSLTPSLP